MTLCPSKILFFSSYLKLEFEMKKKKNALLVVITAFKH